MRGFIKKGVYLFIILGLFIISPLNVSAKTHDYSLQAYDWDATANDWEGEGTEDEISSGGNIRPGQVFKVDLYYSPGDTAVTSMQIGIKYDSNYVEPILDAGELYIEYDMSTTYQGGIWPAAGTSTTNKKRTNWTILYNDDSEEEMLKFIVKDTKGSVDGSPLETEGIIASVYFKVKDTVTSGTSISLQVDETFTRTLNKYPKTVSGIDLNVQTDMSSNVNLDTLTLTGNNGIDYLFDPEFIAGTASRTFNAVVPNSVSSITIGATASDENSKILAGGIGNKPLTVGDNSFNLVVQAEDGTQEIYVINIKRLSNDITLKTLTLTGATLDNNLSSSVFTYTATVPYSMTKTTVSAETTHKNATITTGTGDFELSNYGSSINTKIITVNAEDCDSKYQSLTGNSCTSKDYILNITRESPSSDNTLKDLKIDGITVDNFSSTTLSYTLDSQPNNKTSININAVASDPKATIEGIGPKTLIVGDNTLYIKVIAEDKSEKTYEIHVRRLSNNANLATLSVASNPQGTLSPNFISTFYDYYTYTYDSTVTSIDITATLEDTKGAMIVSGTGSYSSSDPEANIVTTAEDGTTKTYKIKFSRNKSSDNTLSSLTIDGYNLNETFSPTTTLYTAIVPGIVDEVNINAVLNDSHAQIISGTGPKKLNFGTNTIQVKVKAENGAERDYNIVITRSKKDIALLSDLQVNNVTVNNFNESKMVYDIGKVSFETTSINVSATPKDSDATVTGTGSINLKTGLNSIDIIVTAQDGVTKSTYTIKVEREKSSNKFLSSLTLAEKSFDFNKTIDTYNIDVDYDISTATITAIPEYKDATATVSGPNFLSVGLNTYTVTVTAEDGTINTYTLNITRARSGNTYLSNITVTSDGINYFGVFNKETEQYNITVPNEVKDVLIATVMEDSANQTVTGDGNKTLSTGLNSFSIVVLAANGDTRTYIVNITRELNGNNNLKSLEVVDQTLSPSFSKEITSYNVSVPSNIDNIVINAAAEDSASTVTGTGNKTIKTGANTFNVVVESEDHNTKTYVIVVTRQASNDSSLSSLSLVGGTLNETFNKEVLNYTANVLNNVTSVTINATASDVKAKSVSGLGVKNLNTGDNRFEIVVTAEDNTTKTYVVVINRALSDNANLKRLELSDGYTFNESFNKNTENYTVTVPNKVAKLTLTAESEDANASISGAGKVNLTTGDNLINIIVTAEDKKTTKTYQVTITREKSSNADLKSLSSTNGVINPTFDKKTKDYTLTVPYEVLNADIQAEKADSLATVEITGGTNLKVGENSVTITVTAEDGTINNYNLVITRQPSSNNYLSGLEVIDLNGVNYITSFSKEVMTYNITVENDIDTVTITATEEDSSTNVKGDGVKNLKVGSNSFTISSISATGISRNYIINIERKKNSNADLKSLAVDSYTLVPDFSPSTKAYTLNVDASVDTVNIQALAESSESTINGDGIKSLVTGLNTFTIEVQAEDGTTNSYAIVINKAASSNNYLASLLLDQPFTPEFNRDTLSYSATVSNDISSVTVNGVAEDPNATVEGNDTYNLVVGNNQINVTVTAENTTFRVYTINVYREASNNNYLSDLKVNGSTISGFNREKNDYTITVSNDILEVDVVPVLEDSTATVVGGGITHLVTGKNTIDIVVTSEDGVSRTYTIEVIREKSANNYLTILSALEGTLSPAFTKENSSYTMQVPYEVESLTLTTVLEDANSKLKITGNENFTVGSGNIVSIEVEAEDGSKNTYEINVERLQQANNYLSNLTVTAESGKAYNLEPAFDKNTLNYTISVDENDGKLNFDGVLEGDSATVTGFGDISVTTFPYEHRIIVTSASGVSRTYNISITKVKSSNADLKDISVSEGTLTPVFDKDVLDYTVNVDSNVSSIDITAILNKGQTVIGDGVHNLEYGDNTFPIAVTAEDGTTKTYTVKVIREQSISSSLDNIGVTNGSLSPTFSSEILDYVAYIGQDAQDITITPRISDILAQVTISLNDGPYQNISSININDLDIENVVKIKVEGSNQDTIYTVTVLEQADEKITSLVYGHEISDGMIKTVKIDTTAEEMKNQLDNDNSKLKIYEKDGVTEYTGDKIGTGMIVKLFKGSKVVDQKVIVVMGDTDGDGIINSIDALKVVNHIIGNELLLGCYLEAADPTKDKTINAIDALQIVNHIIGTISLF